MKIKSLLIGMLACTALVGCTDDDVLGGGANGQQEVATKGETYISLSFTSKTDSSRGTAGDNDGNADDSNHHVAGTTQENTINSVLVIISEEGTAEAYKDYGLKGTDNSFINGYVKTYTANELTEGTVAGDKALPENLRVDYQSNYKALVVINPVNELKAAVSAHGQDHAAAYKEVCEYQGLGIENNLFMMSNKEEALIKTSEANRDPENAASTTVNVERAASKITFRHSDALQDAPAALASAKDVHKIDVTINHFVAKTANFWYHRDITLTGSTTPVTTYYYAIFNEAKVGAQTYWVLLKNGADLKMEDGQQLDPKSVDGVFTYDGTATYTGAITVDGKLVQQQGNLLTEVTTFDEALIRSMTFVQEKANPASTSTEYYVHLQDYALVNYIPTTDKVYAVRHITKDYTTTKVMGVLGTEYPYLVDPNSTAKNAGTFTGFTNKAADVNAAVEAWRATPDTKPAVFNTLASVVDDEISNKTTATPHSDYTVGSFMTYCYENAFTATASTVGNVTGIVLAGQIYDKDGNAVPVMYKYNGNFYRTLRHLLNTVEGTLTYTKGDKTYTLTENTSDEDADLVPSLDVYVNGKCYYYSAGIKHFEGTKADEAEPMEYAIMRNNIYSLAVTGINAIGSADLKLQSGASVIDQSAYVTLEVSILPWIVRFNDIQL